MHAGENSRQAYTCQFCKTVKPKENLLLIHLENSAIVAKICLFCRENIDRKHMMRTEKLP